MRSPKPSGDVAGDDIQHRVPPAPGRRKGSSARLWLVVTADGDSKLEEVGRQSIMRRTGLPARDLRVLDPAFSYPSTILGRERAIVINLEHIKAIITAAEVLIAHSKDPLVAPFVQDLQTRVSNPVGGGNQEAADAGDMVGEALSKNPSFSAHGARNGSESRITGETLDAGGQEGHNLMPLMNIGGNENTKVVPFEFRALEVCLESTCKCLEQETTNLEQEAYPALDELTSKISTLNLERVRQIKSRLVAISGRVQKVRDELEHLLDDDMDMAEMYLTEKLQHRFGESSSRVYSTHIASENDEEEDDIGSEAESSIHESLGVQKPHVEELEMLLEAYFVQIDGTLNKLSHLREYVDDTEDYINIMLDEKQNQLLQMGVMLSTATVVATAGVVVVSLFGMNITIDLYNVTTHEKFWETTFGTVAGCVVLYVLAIGFGKKKGLLQ